jgi:RNA polymerase sigma factor (sigma-70 family)
MSKINEQSKLEQVFECRYFAGLTEEEAAEALGVSVSTVQRDWRRAKAWLREALGDDA